MKTIEVVCAIIKRDNKILATQRGYGELEGGWEFPGGKIEPGETPEEALVREIREELEAEIEIERSFCSIEYDYNDFRLAMECFLCRLVSDGITLTEHSDARWLEPDELNSVAWLPADTAVIESLSNA